MSAAADLDVVTRYLAGMRDELRTLSLLREVASAQRDAAAPGSGIDLARLVVQRQHLEGSLEELEDTLLPCRQFLKAHPAPAGSSSAGELTRLHDSARTLVDDILRRALSRRFHQSKDTPGKHREIRGLEQIDKVIVIDQSPIGRSPRSNPSTYTGVFGPIRDLFGELPLSRQRGYDPGRFSFNVDGGRCETCHGDGLIKIDMHFLSDVYVTCETCNGRRYNHETLQVSYRGKNIADVLDLGIEEARQFFRKIPAIHSKLESLCDVGLGYLKLGQAATTLSGGEAQRVKLAAELAKKATGKTLYIFDEPTTGLHFEDIRTLLGVLFALRNNGNTLIVIEHNLDVIKCADWVLDLGPGGGSHGGRIVAEGPPEKISASPESLTGKYLKRYLS